MNKEVWHENPYSGLKFVHQYSLTRTWSRSKTDLNQEDQMSDHEVPKPDWKDNTLAVIKIGASAIPVAGGPIVEGLNFIDIRYLAGKRLRNFCEGINERLKLLEEGEGPSAEELSQDETFITTLLHAIQAATRSHQEEKLRALRNAVLNSALPSAPDEDMQLIFINLLDSMTASHLRVLLALDDPTSLVEKDVFIRGPRSLVRALPDGMERRAFYDEIVRELQSKGLITVTDFQSDKEEYFNPRHYRGTTEMGHQLVQFIKSPMLDDHERTQEE